MDSIGKVTLQQECRLESDWLKTYRTKTLRNSESKDTVYIVMENCNHDYFL